MNKLKAKKLYRGARLKDKRNVAIDRFIPKSEYITVENRFSPSGVEWLYLAISSSAKKVKEMLYKRVSSRSR